MQPRSTSGYMFAIQSLILEKMGLCEISPELKECASALDKLLPKIGPQSKTAGNISKQVARSLASSAPVFYGHGIMSPVARCWHAQFNENAKILSWWGEFPEMNHNEIVGWDGDRLSGNYTPVFIRDTSESARIKRRIELTKRFCFAGAGTPIDILPREGGEIARMFSALWIGEFASVYLALLHGTDPTPVGIIEKLKTEMAKG